jgi:hypothetical protein
MIGLDLRTPDVFPAGWQEGQSRCNQSMLKLQPSRLKTLHEQDHERVSQMTPD